MERAVDEYLTRGYRITSQGENSTQLKERDWGDGGTHLIIAALSAWWTFGLSNVLYAIYAYVTAEEVLITVEGDDDDR